ncbi:hypothetical protein [Rhodococcus wratislaviensis]|uniref:hypothetical protein n=1 Tax=Rhodococcus wratislaviensis TaxID=44752 RepID=UPI0036645A47
MHDLPLIHALGLVGVVGASLPLFWARSLMREVLVAHLVMAVVMAAMFLPGGTAGWVSVGTGCLLIALAMWVTADTADHSTAFPCAADLTAMAVILLFVSPALTYSDGTPRSDGHHAPLHAHQLAEFPTTSATWLGPLVLTCWAAIALHPLLARREPIGRQAKITVASGVLMLTGMVPMAA